MWSQVLMWGFVALLALILFGLIRHGWRIHELARDDAAESARRDAETAVFTRISEPTREPARARFGTRVLDAVAGGWSDDAPTAIRNGALEVRRLRNAVSLAVAQLGPDKAPVKTADTTAVTRPTLVVSPVAEPERAPRRLVSVDDELGTWEPSAHQQTEALILGDVLAWRKWKTVRPDDVGMGSK